MPISITKRAKLPYVIDDNDTAYVVKQGVKLLAGSATAIAEGATSSSNRLRFDGFVASSSYEVATLDLAGRETEVLIGRKGYVGTSGEVAIRFAGEDQSFVNNGKVDGVLDFSGAESFRHFENNGLMEGTVRMGATTFELVLGKESEVNGRRWGYGITRDAAEGVSTTTVNLGKITAAHAFSSVGGNETFINKGIVSGNIELGAGNDTFQQMKGTFYDEVHGGSGDDTYIIGNFRGEIVEKADGGNDTVRAKWECYLDYDAEIETVILTGSGDGDLSGSRFDNHLVGNAAQNRITGHGGNDKLEGGVGADIFVMMEEFGHDVVLDFLPGTDRINVLNWDGLETIDAVWAASTEVDGGVLITVDEDSIFLEGVALAQLTAADFVLPS